MKGSAEKPLLVNPSVLQFSVTGRTAVFLSKDVGVSAEILIQTFPVIIRRFSLECWWCLVPISLISSPISFDIFATPSPSETPWPKRSHSFENLI